MKHLSATRSAGFVRPLPRCAFRMAAGVAAVSCYLVLFAGCSSNDRGYVIGVVRLNGQPVGPGTVVLEPVAPGMPGAIAPFGEDGKYKVVSSGKKEGAHVGEYRVTITAGDSGSENVDPKAKMKIPARYSNVATSNLTLTVEPKNNEKDFDLKP
jgi:hypothetical protein